MPLTTQAVFGLVKEAAVYDANQTTVLKKTVAEYDLSSVYTSRRIIGLPSKTEVHGLESSGLNLVSKVTYAYDEEDFTHETNQIIAPIQHDAINFGASFVAGRGNPTSVTRWNAEYPASQSEAVTSKMRYDIAGSPVAAIDPLGRKVRTEYADAFNDTTTSRNTFAYPTKLIDPAGNFSTVEYRFDTGANVFAESPAPAGNTSGKETARIYDGIGRLEKETLVNTGAYTRYEYPANGIQSKVFSTIVDADDDGADADDEVYSESWTDGAGRTLRARTEHPNSIGGFSGTLTEYDTLGQVKRSSVPTEINQNYIPAGDDEARGWLWTQAEYDWMGRTVREINTDGTDKLYSYDGCGCAGGQITTVRSELVPRDDQPTVNARRTQKIYADILGRSYKTEVLNWDGATPYTTTVQTFNGRDQVTKTRQYAGAANSSTFQDVSMSYDGHGRMKRRQYPIEDAMTGTTWIYNADDSVQQVIDPRNAITSFVYNTRGLVSNINYLEPSPNPSNIPVTPDVSFTYDALGNRTQMTDGTGTTIYNYDELSRLTSETIDFDDLSNNLTIGYSYHLSGLKSVTDPFGSDIEYAYDKTGKLTQVTGDAFGENTTGNYASGIQYRAFGHIKQMDYDLPAGDSRIKLEYDSRLRVSHSETTLAGSTTSFLLKANYSYFADGRVAAKDDLLDDAWDRTSKYDFAGRLTFNQFGLAPTTGKRIYEQTIIYDQFSQMTSRNTTYWETHTNAGGTFQNGRKTYPNPPTYDAAGNTTIQSETGGGGQVNTFDAAGRRISVRDRWRLSAQALQEDETGYEYDGNGQAVIEKRGMRMITSANPPPMVVNKVKYQVWSTVLGTSLTTVSPQGNKIATKVFAGGTHIATQNAEGASSPAQGNILFHTTDPVTGTIGAFFGSASSPVKESETEPMGQQIELTDPGTSPPASYDAVLGNGRDPEWQCLTAKLRGSNFRAMPVHCQKQAALNDDEFNGSYVIIDESSPKKVSNLVDSPLPEMYAPTDEMMSYALASSSKKDKKPKKKPINGGNLATVQSERANDALIDMSSIPGADASRSGAEKIDDSTLGTLRGNLEKLMADTNCGQFINAVIDNLPNPKSTGGKPEILVEKFKGTILENFDRVRKDGGFWTDDIALKGLYNAGKITFGNSNYKPNSDAIIKYGIDEKNLVTLAKNFKGYEIYEVSAKLSTTFTLVHELIHAYYPRDGAGKVVANHIDMAEAAGIALKKLGIQGKIPPIEEASKYFDSALIKACWKVKL